MAEIVRPEEALLAAAAARAAAMVDRNGAALVAHLHEGFVWTSHRGDRFDREAYVHANTAGDLRWVSQRLEEATIFVDGDTAVLTAVAVDQVVRAEAEQELRLPVTMTWVLRQGRWLCLVGHAGPPLA